MKKIIQSLCILLFVFSLAGCIAKKQYHLSDTEVLHYCEQTLQDYYSSSDAEISQIHLDWLCNSVTSDLESYEIICYYDIITSNGVMADSVAHISFKYDINTKTISGIEVQRDVSY